MLAVIGSFEGKTVRSVENFRTKDGTDVELGWVLADVCACLGIENPRDWARALDADELGAVDIVDAIGRMQETLVISEPGLYKLLARSRKPEAKRFDRWVRHEVLPTIRKTGGYGINHQHSDDLATLIGDAVAGAIRPALVPMQNQLSLMDERLRAVEEQKPLPPWAPVCDDFGLAPLDQWLTVSTIRHAPRLSGLYRIQWHGERTIYVGKADGKDGLNGRLNGNGHDCLKYLKHVQQPYSLSVCPTPFSGRKLVTAESALRAALKADWEYGGVIDHWIQLRELLVRVDYAQQPSLFD